MASALKSLPALVPPALLATCITAVMQQFPREFVGSQHDSLHIALRVADPALFPHDAFAAAASHQPTILWHLVGWLAPLDGPAGVAALAVGVVALNFLFFLGLGILVRALGGSLWAAAVAMMVLCGMGDPLIGANYIIANHVTASGVVAGPLLVALALAVAGRTAWAMAVVGLVANVHVLQSAYVGGLIVGGEAARLLLTGRREPRAFLPLTRALGVGALCALPVLILIASGPGGATPSGWADAILRGHVIHYYLFSQLPMQLLRTAGLLVLGAGLVAIWAKRPVADGRSTHHFLTGVLVVWVVGFLLVGSIASDLAKVPLAIKVQPLRATMWVLLLVVPAGCVMLEMAIRDRRTALAWALVGVLGAMLVLNVLRPFGGAFNARLTPFVLLFAAVVLAAPFLRERLDRYTGVVAGLALVPPVSVLIIWLGLVPGLEVLSTGAGFQLLVLVLFVGGLLWASRGPVPLPTIRLVAVASGLTAVAIAGLILLSRVERGEPLLFMPRDEAWHEAASFLREGTPVDAVIQGDPRRTGLRTTARRSVFFEQDDDGALYFEAASLEWLRDRAELLRVPLIKTYGRPAPWPIASVPWAELARDHGVTHAMVPPEAPVPGAVLFENDAWKIVALKP